MKKFHISVLRTRVLVRTDYRSSFSNRDRKEITEWVIDRELGVYAGHNIWKLTNRGAVTLFLLHWGAVEQRATLEHV